MLKLLQRILPALLLLAVISPAAIQAAPRPIGLVINGQPLDNPAVNPVILYDRMMVPVRGVFERLGADVEWQAETRSVYIRANNRVVVAPVDRGAITLDGSAIDVPVPAQIINDSAMIPVAAVATALGFEVDFREHTVFIDGPRREPILPEPVLPEPILPESQPVLPELSFDAVPELPPSAFPEEATPPVNQELPLPVLPDIPLPEVPNFDFQAPPDSSVLLPEAPDLPMPEIADLPVQSEVPGYQTPNSPVPQTPVPQTPNPEFGFVPQVHAPGFVPPFIPAPGMVINTLQSVDFETVPGQQDTLILQGVSPQNISVEARPGAMTIRLDNVFMSVTGDVELDGQFARRISMSSFTQFTGMIIVTTTGNAAYTVQPLGFNNTAIILHPPTYRNIYYDFAARTLRIPKTDGFAMDTGLILHQDWYHQRLYNLVLPMDASAHLGFGEFMINDHLLRSVNISTMGAVTQLQLRGSQIIAVLVEEDDENYLIRILHPREKYARIVVLDAGHGGRFPGAVRGDVRESNLNMLVQNKLIQLLEEEGSIRVYTIRNSDVHLANDLATDLLMRSQVGNDVGDIFVSLHHNAATNTAVHGAETFYFASAADSTRTLTSRRLAEIMQRHKLIQLGSHDRGVRSGNFSVLRNSQVPAVLLEFGFMSNPAELARMTTPEFQWGAARATFNGLLEAFAQMPVRQVRG